jgi:polysaccharide deacetylase family protein (PEP-CTERM system associated)
VQEPEHVLTVDVEDWFHILEADGAHARGEWDGLESRVEANTDRLLALFEAAGARATFFVVGWVAARQPALVRRIADAGHEIGSHSYWHEVVGRHDRASLAADLGHARKLLEDLTGRPVRGFRAPGFSITPETVWALDVVIEQGFAYDASLWAGRASHGGFPTPFPMPHRLRCAAGELLELPASTRVGRLPFPYGGGGYLRLLPGPMIGAAIAWNARRGVPTTLYVHPRDFDPGQPRMALAPLRRFKYYVGVSGAEAKLRRLLQAFRWTSAWSWLETHADAVRDRVLDLRVQTRAAAPARDPVHPPPPPSADPALRCAG